jgi:hypothetical protein
MNEGHFPVDMFLLQVFQHHMVVPNHRCGGNTTLWRDPKLVKVLTQTGPQLFNRKLEVQGRGSAWGIYLRHHNTCLSGHEAANLSR